MTAKDFRHAAAIVRAIAAGDWTLDPPAWANEQHGRGLNMAVDDCNYTRAVWIAEAMIMFCQQSNPRFNREKFLKACGLQKGS